VKSEEVQVTHSFWLSGTIFGKNWDLSKEKLRPHSGLYLYLVSKYPSVGVLLTF
jgi:hypothetical protein